jgi:hypothetical protein
VWRGFGIGIKANAWASDPAGTISDVHFNNVHFDTPGCSRNVIAGDAKTKVKVSQVYFKGLEYGGKCIKDGGQERGGGKFIYKFNYTEDIEFSC